MPPCGCNAGKKFEWVGPDGGPKVIYKTEVEARAQVIRKGGTYQAITK